MSDSSSCGMHNDISSFTNGVVSNSNNIIDKKHDSSCELKYNHKDSTENEMRSNVRIGRLDKRTFLTKRQGLFLCRKILFSSVALIDKGFALTALTNACKYPKLLEI